MKLTREIRSRPGLERRALTEAEKTAGYIGALGGDIPFNSDSHELRDRSLNNGKPFIEQVTPDAFKRSLTEDKDIMGFVGHSDAPLDAFARIGENMAITTDEAGMHYRALVPDTAAGRDLLELVDKKVIRGTSFEFSVRNAAGEKWEKRGSQDVRIITDARLYTVNPVAWPAYPDSELMAERGRGGSRRGSYFGTDASYDPAVSADVAFAIESLGGEVCELCDTLEYLRDNPSGALADYARSEAADAAEDVTMLVAWLAANGATVPADDLARATKAVTEAKTLTPATAVSPHSVREERLRIFHKK